MEIFAFDLECEFLIGRSLTVALTMKNCSDAPVVVTDALHTYFAVKEAEAIRVHGLDQVGYEDRVVGAPVVLGHVQQGDIRIDREVDRYRAVTSGQLQEVARRAFRRENANTLYYMSALS